MQTLLFSLMKNGIVIMSSSVRNKKRSLFFIISFLHSAFCDKKQKKIDRLILDYSEPQGLVFLSQERREFNWEQGHASPKNTATLLKIHTF